MGKHRSRKINVISDANERQLGVTSDETRLTKAKMFGICRTEESLELKLAKKIPANKFEKRSAGAI